MNANHKCYLLIIFIHVIHSCYSFMLSINAIMNANHKCFIFINTSITFKILINIFIYSILIVSFHDHIH